MRILSGNTAIREVLKKKPERVEKVFAREDKLSSDLVSLAKSQGLSVELSKERREEKSGADVFLSLKQYQSPSIAELAASAKGCGRPILVLDQIQDPQNLGALFRLAAASGLPGVIFTKNSGALINDTVRRVSRGGTEFVSHVSVNNLQRTLKELQSEGIWVYGTSLDESSEDFYQVDLGQSVALVLGSEGRGLRPLTAKTCDSLLSIPMPGEIQSLNVSQAASIMVFELLRRLG